jgi:hypothetical protein
MVLIKGNNKMTIKEGLKKLDAQWDNFKQLDPWLTDIQQMYIQTANYLVPISVDVKELTNLCDSEITDMVRKRIIIGLCRQIEIVTSGTDCALESSEGEEQ